MADVMSTNTYLSLAGLQYYDGKIKDYIAAADTALQNGMLATIAEDAAVSGKYVSRVYAEGGVIKVDRVDLPTLNPATASVLGGVKIGDNIQVANDGTISVNVATASQLGVAQAGSNINVSNGVFSVNTATDAQLGLAQAGTNINVANGVFSVPAASASVAGVMSAADYAKLAAFTQASDYALKADIATAYIYRGSVANYAALPASGMSAGDVYNAEDTGMNYAYNGTAWDALGSTFDVSSIANTDIDALFA